MTDDYDDFSTYPIDKEDEIMSKKLKAGLLPDSVVPQGALINPSKFKAWVTSNLIGIQEAPLGLKWIRSLKGQSTLKHQRKLMEAVEVLEKQYVSLVETQTSKITAQTGLLEAERDKILAEWELDTIDEDLEIRKLKRIKEKKALELEIVKTEQEILKTKSPKLAPADEVANKKEQDSKSLKQEIDNLYDVLKHRIRKMADLEMELQRTRNKLMQEGEFTEEEIGDIMDDVDRRLKEQMR